MGSIVNSRTGMSGMPRIVIASSVVVMCFMSRWQGALGTGLVSALLCLLLLVGCGGGGGGGSGHTPSISGLTMSRDHAYIGEAGGEVTVRGTVEFHDAGGDLASLWIVILDETGGVVDVIGGDILGAAGYVSGTIEADVLISTAAGGSFTLEISAMDAGFSYQVISRCSCNFFITA